MKKIKAKKTKRIRKKSQKEMNLPAQYTDKLTKKLKIRMEKIKKKTKIRKRKISISTRINLKAKKVKKIRNLKALGKELK